jgi:hypothetical protein
MNRTSLTNVCIVVKVAYDGSAVCTNDTGDDSQGNITNLVVFNSGDVDDRVGIVVELTDIGPANATIGTTVN